VRNRSAANNLKQTSKTAAAAPKLMPKTTGSKAGLSAALRSKQKSAPLDAMQPKRSCNSVKEPEGVDVAEKMPRLKANKKQNATTMREKKSMPILQQEMSFAESSHSAKMSPRKRQQQPPATKVNAKVPKLLSMEETSCIAERRGSLRNKAAAAETLSGDSEMPQLLAVEPVEKAGPLEVTVDEFESPPVLDQSPSCAVKEPISTEQKNSVHESPVRCLRDDKDAVVATLPRCMETAADQRAKNSAPKHSPVRSKHHASQLPVSNRTALSQNNCSVSSPIAVTQTEFSMSVDCCDSQQLVVTTTHNNCSTSLQPWTTPLIHTGSDIGSVTETKTEDVSATVSTEPGGEIVPYTCPTINAGGQWQVPCGVPMAPFIITGMYPMMGSGYRYPVMSFPPLVTPAVPAATSVISARGCSLPSSRLQYSGYQLPLSAAAPVVPLYMSPVVGPFMQPGSAASHMNLMPFMTSLPHAATAVHSQQSSATLVLRPSMSSPEHLYTVSCMLPAQQQVNLSLSGHSVCCCLSVSWSSTLFV